MQKLFLKTQYAKLLKNGAARDQDHAPVVKLFTPWGGATWLLSEIDPEDPDIAFGLCDLGMGEPELGYVSLSEMRSIRGPFGLYIERDIHWEGKFPMSVYADAARAKGRIVDFPKKEDQ